MVHHSSKPSEQELAAPVPMDLRNAAEDKSRYIVKRLKVLGRFPGASIRRRSPTPLRNATRRPSWPASRHIPAVALRTLSNLLGP